MKLAELTVNERILLHLRDFSSDYSGVTALFEQTQEGISKGVDVRINHVPRAVKKLKNDGFIEEFPAHVHGLRRKRKVYQLTDAGRGLADKLLNGLMDEEVTLRREDGEEERIQIRNVPMSINTSASMSQIVLHTFSHGLILVMKLNRSLEPEPELISNLVDVPLPEHFYGREDEIEVITDFIDSDSRILLISGIKGIGKTSLVRHVMSVLEGQTNIFWFNANEWDTSRSFFEKMTQMLTRLGKTALVKYLKSVTEVDINYAFKAFMEDIQDLEVVVIFDNAFNLQKDLEHVPGIICDRIDKVETAKFIITTRDDAIHTVCGVPLPSSSQSLRLGGLEKKDASEMMSALGIDESQHARIYEMSTGHPLVLELVKSGQIEKLIDTSGLTKEELLVVKCLKAYDAIFG